MPPIQAHPGPDPATRVLDRTTIGDHFDRLYRVALRYCGSREPAEDLVQDTYVRVLARPRILRNDDDLAYLLRALRNTFASQRRNARARPALASVQDLDRFADRVAPAPQAALDGRLALEAIAALPAPFRDALVGVDVAGLPYREAARSLGIGEGTLTSRLSRARERVAAVLDPTNPTEG